MKVVYLLLGIFLCPLPVDGFFFSQPDTRPIEEKLADYGIIVKETYPMLPVLGHSGSLAVIDFSLLIEDRPLRRRFQDILDFLNRTGETPEETERIAYLLQATETILEKRERELEEEIDTALSKYWPNEEKKPLALRHPLKIKYDVPYWWSLNVNDLKKRIEREVKNKRNALEFGTFEEITEAVIGSYFKYFKQVIKQITEDTNNRILSRHVFTADDLEDRVFSFHNENYYNESIYKKYPNESLQLLTIGSLGVKRDVWRQSKYQLAIMIRHPVFVEGWGQKVYRIETAPQLVDGYYAQSILPEFITIADENMDRVLTTDESLHKSIFLGGKLVSQWGMLPDDCTVKDRTGCQFILTPKEKFEAENPELVVKTDENGSDSNGN